MEFDNFTERARGFIQSAQTLALRSNHQQLTPLHLLKCLLEDTDGLAAKLINAAGGDAKQALINTEAELKKLPKVEGTGAPQTYLAPELTMISFPSAMNFSPPLSTSTPVALVPSKISRCTVVFGLMVRFNRWRPRLRYPRAVLQRMPLGLFTGQGPTPEASGRLWSGLSAKPSARHAAKNACWSGDHSWGLNRRTTMGPSELWKSPPPKSVSDSTIRKYWIRFWKAHSSFPLAAQES
ncbi:MAG TPA: hypothetical protein EYO85_04705 [Rhodospirillales bacterium]|nr:hypothetical protein [Rhodospirillales bacterium]